MNARRFTLEQIGFVLIALCLGFVQLKLQIAQILLFTPASIIWLVLSVRDGRLWDALRPRRGTPAFFLPLLLYGGWTLASSAASGNPVASFIDSRQLLMFLMVPIVARLASGTRATQTVDVIIAVGSAGALVGIVQFALLGYNNLDHRPMGLLSHYMTYSGLLMLVFCAAVARLLFKPTRVAWPMIAIPALLVALVVTFTRNAWIGTFLAVSVLLAIRNWKLVMVAPVVAVIALVLAPGLIQSRAKSILDTNDPANRDRIVMWKIGRDMIRDHPFFGMGPEQIDKNYERYRQAYPEAVNPTNPHLHNVPIQIAAERGIPALLLWLWFVVSAAVGFFKQIRARVAPDIAGAGLAALVAMLAAGIFEYNFGDSEFLMLLLGILTLPFAATKETP